MSTKAGRAQNPDLFPLAAPQGINYLLAVGIDAYAHCPTLYNCVKDAQDFMQALLGKYRFDEAHIYTLFNEQATRRNILNRLRDLRTKITSQDNLIIYFSGHGEYDAKSQMGFWIPVEAQPLEDAEYISNTDITARLDAIDSFHTFLIVDACFAGSLFVNYKNVQPGAESKRSRWGLAASHSREVALDGTRGDNSPFARCLIRTISQNTDVLGVQELAAEVIDQVQQETGGKQTPVGQPLNVRGHDLGQFFFHLKMNEAQDWAAAQQENTLVAYQRFLAMYSNGAHTAEAQTTVAFLQEEAVWKDANTLNTVSSYDRYLQQYRQGRYSRMAIDAQKVSEEADAWTRATQRNTISAYRDFQYNYSESKYYKEAEGRIQQLQTPVTRNETNSVGNIANSTPSAVSNVSNGTTAAKKSRIAVTIGGVISLLIIMLIIWKPWNPTEVQKTEGVSVNVVNEMMSFQNIKKMERPTIPAYQDFIITYPSGKYADSAREEIRSMELKVLIALKDANAYLSVKEEGSAIQELETIGKLGSENKFINYALTALKEKKESEAKTMLNDGIQLQNKKLKE